MNKRMIYSLCACLLMTTQVFALSNAMDEPMLAICSPILSTKVRIDDKILPISDSFMQDTTLMVPLREIGEQLNFEFTWDGATQTISMENGEIKTTLTIGVNSYYKQDSNVDDLSAATKFGSAPCIKDDKTYVPIELFYLLCPNSDNQVTTADMLKKVSLTIEDVYYSISLTLPDVISTYVDLNVVNIDYGDNETYPMILLQFSNGTNKAVLGHFSIFTKEQYAKILLEEGPKEKEVYVDNHTGIVITFSGLQDMPFEIGSLEADLVNTYLSQVGAMLESVKVYKAME